MGALRIMVETGPKISFPAKFSGAFVRLGASQVSQAKMYAKTSFNKDVFYRRLSCLVLLFSLFVCLFACFVGIQTQALIWRLLCAIPEVELLVRSAAQSDHETERISRAAILSAFNRFYIVWFA